MFPLLLISLSNFKFLFFFFCIHCSRNTKREEKNIVENVSEFSQEKSSERKKEFYGVEVCFHCSRISQMFLHSLFQKC